MHSTRTSPNDMYRSARRKWLIVSGIPVRTLTPAKRHNNNQPWKMPLHKHIRGGHYSYCYYPLTTIKKRNMSRIGSRWFLKFPGTAGENTFKDLHLKLLKIASRYFFPFSPPQPPTFRHMYFFKVIVSLVAKCSFFRKKLKR